MLTRILTGLVGVPIVVWLLHSGGMLFNAAIFVLAAIGWLEFYNMAKNKGYNVFLFFVRYYDLGAGRKFDVFG